MKASSYKINSQLNSAIKLISIFAVLLSLSGCLLTSPYWNQEFSSHTAQIPLQAWTTDSSEDITFECSPAYHGGLYPYWGPVWSEVITITPELPGALDPAGSRIYSAAYKNVLPSNCWRRDPANNIWYAAIRAVQDGDEYSTFDKVGLECLGRENGKAASWFGWLSKSCTKTYSNSSNNIPFVIFRAPS